VVVATMLSSGPVPHGAAGDLWIGLLNYDVIYGKPLPAQLRAGLQGVAVSGTVDVRLFTALPETRLAEALRTLARRSSRQSSQKSARGQPSTRTTNTWPWRLQCRPTT